jgi:ADP-heptose:LPS heptosyltransferase
MPDIVSGPRAVRFGLGLRRRRYDWVVLLDRSRLLRAAIRLSGARRVAAVVPETPETRHEVDVYLDAICPLVTHVPGGLPRMTLDQSARERALQLPQITTRSIVVLQPGGAENPGAYMPEKRWPAPSYAKLAAHLTTLGCHVLLTGGPSDIERCREIAKSAELPQDRVLAGHADLLTSAAVIECACLYVGTDTGMSHIAAALGTPSVVIFGPTNPRRYQPRGEHVRVVAAPGAWNVPDRDLRGRAALPDDTSTVRVTVEQVIAACAELFALRAGTCSL